MIFEIKLNGVTVSKDIPTDWDQVKFKDFLLLDNATESKAASIFTGIDEATLKKSKVKNLDKFLKAISFVSQPVQLLKIPKSILGHAIPKDIGFEAFGQYADLKDAIDSCKSDSEVIKKYPLFCAIYCTNPYDSKIAESKIEEFENAPCTEVVGLGNFLMLKLIALKRNTDPTYRKEATLLKRLRLVLKSWRARLAFTVRYYILKRKLHLQEKS